MSFTVVRALGLCTVQDLGRPGRMHEAVPPGGALVADRLISANRAARNPDGAAALEILGQLTIRAEREIGIATDASPLRGVPPGAEIVIASEPRRVAYLSVRGGLDAPLLLGSRGALLCAGLGGLVRAGQRFELAGLPETPPMSPPAALAAAPGAPIRLVPGPDPDHFGPGALETLLSGEYRILPSSDRVGTRLDGPALPRTQLPEVSRPMVIGALEVPRDGKPIVLGPEHPTTGGYPIVAVVARADLGRLFAIRLGGTVRFTR